MVYDINRFARETARDSDFEHMMWYAFYVISEGRSDEGRDAILKGVADIVDSANAYHFCQMRIYELKLTSFVLIMDDIHTRIARDKESFETYSTLLRNLLEALFDNNLIDTNPMDQLMADQAYLGKYGW